MNETALERRSDVTLLESCGSKFGILKEWRKEIEERLSLKTTD